MIRSVFIFLFYFLLNITTNIRVDKTETLRFSKINIQKQLMEKKNTRKPTPTGILNTS